MPCDLKAAPPPHSGGGGRHSNANQRKNFCAVYCYLVLRMGFLFGFLGNERQTEQLYCLHNVF
jgi:hypothetical protein